MGFAPACTRAWIIAFASTLLAGCSSSIFRSPLINDNEWVVMSADQRVVLNVPAKTEQGFPGRNVPTRIVCPEPSPDIAKSVSVAFAANLEAIKQGATLEGQDNLGVSAGLRRDMTESLVQLGQRVATLQLLRDELADLCRSYANGAITSTTYTIRLSKLDRKMVTLLSTEAAAGALGKSLAAIDSMVMSGTDRGVATETVDHASKRVTDAGANLTAIRKKIDDIEAELKKLRSENASATTIAEREKALKDEREKVEPAVREAASTQFQLTMALMGSTRASSGVLSRAIPGQQASGGNGFPLDIVALQQAFLTGDDLSTLMDACLTTLDSIQKPDERYEKQQVDIRRRLETARGSFDEKLALVRNLEEQLESLRRRGISPDSDEYLQRRQNFNKARSELQVPDRQVIELESELKLLAQAQSVQNKTPLAIMCEQQWPTLVNATTRIAHETRSAIQKGFAERTSVTSKCLDVMRTGPSTADQVSQNFCRAHLQRETGAESVKATPSDQVSVSKP